MALEDSRALKVGHVVDSHGHVDASSDEAGADRVEVEVQDFVGVATQNGHALATSDVPNPAGLIDRGGAAHVASELELRARDFSSVALKHVDGLARLGVPDLTYARGTIAVPSNEPVRILSPSALKFRETISPSWPFKVECSLPVSRSHNFAV